MKPATPLSAEIMKKLKDMLADPEMITLDAYSPDTASFPNNRIPFIEQHIRYLQKHKNVNPEHYISNLQLMIKRR